MNDWTYWMFRYRLKNKIDTKNEQILWDKYDAMSRNFHEFKFMPFIITISLVVACFLWPSPPIFIYVFLFASVVLSVLYVLFYIKDSNAVSEIDYFLVTNKRLLLQKDNKTISVPFKVLIRIEEKKDSLLLEYLNKKRIEKIELPNKESLVEILKQRYRNSNIFTEINHRLKYVAKKNKLNFETKVPWQCSMENSKIALNLELNGSKVLTISVLCENAEGLYLNIENEKSSFILKKKLLGLQDLQVGEKEYDRAFLFQSNDPDRFQAIQKQVDLDQILALSKLLDGQFLLGVPSKSSLAETKKINDIADVIDMQLLIENQPKTGTANTEKGDSKLVYSCQLTEDKAIDENFVRKAVALALDCTIMLGKAIEKA